MCASKGTPSTMPFLPRALMCQIFSAVADAPASRKVMTAGRTTLFVRVASFVDWWDHFAPADATVDRGSARVLRGEGPSAPGWLGRVSRVELESPARADHARKPAPALCPLT
jgi:hypothetical protein